MFHAAERQRRDSRSPVKLLSSSSARQTGRRCRVSCGFTVRATAGRFSFSSAGNSCTDTARSPRVPVQWTGRSGARAARIRCSSSMQVRELWNRIDWRFVAVEDRQAARTPRPPGGGRSVTALGDTRQAAAGCLELSQWVARSRMHHAGKSVPRTHRRRASGRTGDIGTILPVSPRAGTHPCSILCNVSERLLAGIRAAHNDRLGPF